MKVGNVVRLHVRASVQPIVVTACALIIGVTPIVFASLVSTILNLVMTPVLYGFTDSIEDTVTVQREKHGSRG